MARKEREIQRWITVNGARVPIFKGQSVEEAVKRVTHKDKGKSSEGESSFTKKQSKGADNEREQIAALKAELKKHPNDAHTEEIKARLKKHQADLKKLEKGQDTGEFKTKKEWDEIESKKNKTAKTFSEIRDTEEGRKLIDSIEEAEEEIRGRGIDPNDESEFWVRARNMDVKELKQKFGYDWDKPSSSAGNKTAKIIADNESLKEKQIAANKAQAETASAKASGKQTKTASGWNKQMTAKQLIEAYDKPGASYGDKELKWEIESRGYKYEDGKWKKKRGGGSGRKIWSMS